MLHGHNIISCSLTLCLVEEKKERERLKREKLKRNTTLLLFGRGEKEGRET